MVNIEAEDHYMFEHVNTHFLNSSYALYKNGVIKMSVIVVLWQPPKKDTKAKQPAKQTAKKKEGGGGGKAKKKKWSKGKVSIDFMFVAFFFFTVMQLFSISSWFLFSAMSEESFVH